MRLHFCRGCISWKCIRKITKGYLKIKDGRTISLFAGNGLKSAVNTFAASESILTKSDAKSYFQKLHSPFERGFKKAFYIYETDKSRLSKRTVLLNKLAAFKKNPFIVQYNHFVELSMKERG